MSTGIQAEAVSTGRSSEHGYTGRAPHLHEDRFRLRQQRAQLPTREGQFLGSSIEITVAAPSRLNLG